MKKFAIATVLALVSGFASAQSVEVYGRMRMYQETDKVGTADSVSRITNDRSRFGVRGSENLGGGLVARFNVETNVIIDAPAATSLGDRESLVGLANKFVSLDLGRAKHTVARLNDKYDVMGGFVFGSSTDVIHQLHDSRVSNTAFIGATPVKGLALAFNHTFSETAGVKNVQSWGADYTLGAGSVGVAQFTNDAINSKSTHYGARYQIVKGTTLHAMYSDDKVRGVDSTGKSFGVRQQLGNNLVGLASYSEKTGALASNQVKAYNLGLTYSLSKRTFLHARYRMDDSVVAANDRKQLGFGVEHNF